MRPGCREAGREVGGAKGRRAGWGRRTSSIVCQVHMCNAEHWRPCVEQMALIDNVRLGGKKCKCCPVCRCSQ